MTPELAYFLKINVAIALFYAFYRLFFHKDTFFHWRRTALLCFFGISLLYPLLNIQEWIKEQEPMVAMADLYATIILPEQIIEAPQETTVTWQELIPQILGVIYWSGVLLLAIRFLIQLGSIIRLHFLCPKSTIQGSRVHILKTGTGPFSFFHWIFINPMQYSDKEINEILIHEQTHVRELHSLDIILVQLVILLCWFNPFSWLIRSEIRMNHEYLADKQVVMSGYDKKSYQYHLLGIKHTSLAAANFYNNFSVLPLKNRIKMLNRKRTRNIMKSKYLMFIPVAALLVLFSNCTNTAEEATKEEEKVDVKFVPTEVKSDTIDTQDEVLDMVEVMPEFPGGVKALMSYLAKNIEYPKEAENAGMQGRVVVQFVVNTDGSIEDAKVVRAVNPLLDQEAIRVINTMPKWKPGMQDGKTVRVKYTVPIMFRLK